MKLGDKNKSKDLYFTIENKNITLKDFQCKVSKEIGKRIIFEKTKTIFISFSWLFLSLYSYKYKNIIDDMFFNGLWYLMFFVYLLPAFQLLLHNNFFLLKTRKQIVKCDKYIEWLFRKRILAFKNNYLEQNEINEEIAQCLINDLERSNKND